ncbi:MAG TPA: hypothetical protein VNW92_16635 [Polyangiaceae bacterium]|jgi:hypothetical protein|nr:hypothetical protein [Polyangiaceae bacterium]
MTIRDPSDYYRRQYVAAMPKVVIPMRRTPWFLKALWLMALLVLVGTVYSFWRISKVASPSLDVPSGTEPATAPAKPGTT